MEIGRETVVEIAVSVAAVGLFVAVILGIGTAYGSAANLSEQGALALIGAIAVFIVAMMGVGYFLAGR
jgi:hypothetical protein